MTEIKIYDLFSYFDDAAQLDSEIGGFSFGNQSEMSSTESDAHNLYIDEDILLTSESENMATINMAYYVVSHTKVGEVKVQQDIYTSLYEVKDNNTTQNAFAGISELDTNLIALQRVFRYVSYRLISQYGTISKPRIKSILHYFGNANNEIGWRCEIEIDSYFNITPCNPYN